MRVWTSLALIGVSHAFVTFPVTNGYMKSVAGNGLSLSPQDVDLSNVISTVASVLPPDMVDQGQTLYEIAAQQILQVPLPARIAALALFAVAWLSQFEFVRGAPQPFPEKTAATYELSKKQLLEFGDAARVRPLLKQTQLEFRSLKLAYDANKHGYDAQTFHQKVDGKGAAIVLCKANNQWFGGYNPRGWASLGGSRPSIASFLFYQKALGWQKLRCLGNGGNACSNDLFDRGIFFAPEGLVIPLDGTNRRSVASRLGTFFEAGPGNTGNKSTLLPRVGQDARLQELKVLVGVYAPNEDIPNSGGVLDLGLY